MMTLDDELNNEEDMAIEINEVVDLDSSQSELLIKLYSAYNDGQLELPSMPEVALNFRDAARDPDVPIEKLSKIIQADAAIAGSLLHAANGSMFCGTSKISDVPDAVMRLGIATTLSLVTAVGLSRVFQVKSPHLKQRVKEIWLDSLVVSGLCYAIAKHVRGLNPDRALLAGLLHHVGAIPIIDYLDSNNMGESPDEVDAAINALSQTMGVMVMNDWEMGDDLLTVINEFMIWNRVPEKVDYCDVVQVAWLYHAAKTGRADGLPSPSEVSAYTRLGLSSPAEETLAGYCTEAQAMVSLSG